MTRTPLLGSSGAPPRRAATSGTAERFAAKVASRRRRRWASLVAILVLLAGLGWVALFSPWLTVDTVRIADTQRVDVAAVHQVVDAELGRPMVLLDTQAVARRVAAIPLVREVHVVRRWPQTVRVDIVERTPVAAVPADGGGSGFRLVDRDGVDVEAVSARPDTVPFLEVNVASAGSAALAAALDVQAGLPPAVSAQVRTLGATSRDGVWFTLRNGARVIWGDSGDGSLKLDVLRALVTSNPDAAHYDVSAPSAPSVSRATVRDAAVLPR
ncbi:MAG: FtsQ-type POTRA domain-containing protein [Kineosporiaceae bacterium]|nr:FtsQ-type POTRA domain-containing protein [Kineosporiaceae bacterium]